MAGVSLRADQIERELSRGAWALSKPVRRLEAGELAPAAGTLEPLADEAH